MHEGEGSWDGSGQHNHKPDLTPDPEPNANTNADPNTDIYIGYVRFILCENTFVAGVDPRLTLSIERCGVEQVWHVNNISYIILYNYASFVMLYEGSRYESGSMLNALGQFLAPS